MNEFRNASRVEFEVAATGITSRQSTQSHRVVLSRPSCDIHQSNHGSRWGGRRAARVASQRPQELSTS